MSDTDTIEITLPSGKTATIRNYTTRADDEKADAVLYAGATAHRNGDINFPIASVMASRAVYVERLTKSLDGDEKNIVFRIKDLQSSDYQVLAEEVDKIVERESPKAPQAKSGENLA